MNNLTLAQKVHLLVGIVAAIVWFGLVLASRMVPDGAGFLTAFADIITLAKATTIGAVSIATAVGNFTTVASPKPDQLTQPPVDQLPQS